MTPTTAAEVERGLQGVIDEESRGRFDLPLVLRAALAARVWAWLEEQQQIETFLRDIDMERLKDLARLTEERDRLTRLLHTMTPTEAYDTIFTALEKADKENERLRGALEWYGEKARAAKRYMEAKPARAEALTALITELALDEGRRASLAPAEGTEPTPQHERRKLTWGA